MYVMNKQVKKIYSKLKVAPACIHALGRNNLFEISGQVSALLHVLCVSVFLFFSFTSTSSMSPLIIKIAQSVFACKQKELTCIWIVVEQLNFSEL